MAKIFDGSKKYEFRRYLAKKDVNRILIYSTAPVMKVVGEVEVIGTLSMKPTPLWEITKTHAGITRDGFREYFSGRKMAHAYKLGRVYEYLEPQPLFKYNIKQAPQSFVYIETEKGAIG